MNAAFMAVLSWDRSASMIDFFGEPGVNCAA
jgi:hypothetical protein